MQPTVLTIILNYKTPDMTIEAAEAALREMAGIEGGVLIVDNQSGDGSYSKMCDAAKARGWTKPRVDIVQSGRNGGFGAGNNFGIRQGFAQGVDGKIPDFFYILNSDAFPDKGAISALLSHLQQNPKTGFAGSYIHGAEGDPHITAFRFPSIASELEGAAKFGPVSRLFKNAIVPLPMPVETCTVDWLAGASMLMRREVLEDIGFFDESFFLYFEETDLCRRAQLAGWRTDYVCESSVTHIGSVSTGMKKWERIPQFWLDSRLHYFLRNHGVAYTCAATLAHILGGSFARLRATLQRKTISEPKYFLIDMAFHALKAAFRRTSLKPRNITFPKGAAPLAGEQT